ncbi:MAG: amine dehydrogenase, partial [Sphingomonadales bacterium]
RLYALVHPYGYEGSHKDGGTEVWVYDIKKKKRIQRVPLKSRAWSMGVTGGEKPMMVTANLAGIMDVYDPAKGEHLRQLEGTVTYNPVAIFPAP